MRDYGKVLRLLLLFLPLFMSATVKGHEVRPAYLGLNETRDGEFNVRWKTPIRGGAPLVLTPEFSGETQMLSPVAMWQAADEFVQMWRLHATPSLRGQAIRIAGLENTMTDVLARIDFAGGDVWVHRFTPQAPVAEIPHRTSRLGGMAAYLKLGVEHILFGMDHLLFVLALLLIVRAVPTPSSLPHVSRERERVGVLAGPSGGVLSFGFRVFSVKRGHGAVARSTTASSPDRHSGRLRLVKTVTAFTVAHSITLGLVTLGIVRVPAAPVESAIALSIGVIAAKLVHLRRGYEGITARAPWIVAFGFGLLHGFGFAEALSGAWFPQGHRPLALLCFNAGVEAGQLVFVAGVLALAAFLSRMHIVFPRWMEPVPPYAIGTAAMFWVFQRIAAF